MIEVCSLDFLKKEKFETDIMTVDGRVLCAKGEKVTPELLLRLYFKEIYVERIVESALPVQQENPEESLIEQLEGLTPDVSVEIESVAEEVVTAAELPVQEEVVDLTEKLEFDEEEARRICEYSVIVGKVLNFSAKKLKELEQAAYYHKIGRTNFTRADLLDKDFKKKQAQAGYDIVLKEKKLPESIAETAKLCISNYDSNTFKLNEEIPYYQIVQIASFYDSLINKNFTKDEALDKMLQLGGNKFNIFVLHKFINSMRGLNG